MKFLNGALALAMPFFASGAEIGLIEEIIAKVNGDIITRSEADKARKQLATELRRGIPNQEEAEKQLAAREKDILRERIDQLLLVQKGKELSINVDADVSKYLADIQRSTKIADPEKFQAFVREQTGMSFEDYKQDLKNGFLTQRVIRMEVGSKINVPRAEIQKYYEEHKGEFDREERVFLRDILVSTEGKDDKGIAAAEKKAKDLVGRARKGEKFPELARDNSDAVTAEKFGELGWFKKEDLGDQFREVVFQADRNFVTDPIRTANGFVILKVEEKHKAGLAQLEEVENEIMEKIYMPKMQPAVREYLTRLRQEAFLEIKPGYVDTGAAPGKNTAWTDPAQLKPETITKEEVGAQTRRRRLLWMVPIPGTQTAAKEGSSKSR